MAIRSTNKTFTTGIVEKIALMADKTQLLVKVCLNNSTLGKVDLVLTKQNMHLGPELLPNSLIHIFCKQKESNGANMTAFLLFFIYNIEHSTKRSMLHVTITSSVIKHYNSRA